MSEIRDTLPSRTSVGRFSGTNTSSYEQKMHMKYGYFVEMRQWCTKFVSFGKGRFYNIDIEYPGTTVTSIVNEHRFGRIRVRPYRFCQMKDLATVIVCYGTFSGTVQSRTIILIEIWARGNWQELPFLDFKPPFPQVVWVPKRNKLRDKTEKGGGGAGQIR